MHWPAHFSTVSISSTSRLQQQPQKQARGKAKEDDRRSQGPSRRGSWSREWSYGLRILLLFESTLFSLMYLSWSLQDFLLFTRFNWYLQFVHQARDCGMEKFLQPIITLWMHLILSSTPLESTNDWPQLIPTSSAGQTDVQKLNFCFDDLRLGTLLLVAWSLPLLGSLFALVMGFKLL